MGKEVEAEAEEKTGGMDLTRGDDCWTQRGKTMMKEKQFHRIGTRQTHPSFSWVVVITECFAPRRKGKERTDKPTNQPINQSTNHPTQGLCLSTRSSFLETARRGDHSRWLGPEAGLRLNPGVPLSGGSLSSFLLLMMID
mmetsp:Transcript_18011/g.49985  ORF Transcript_18011/g.49985 Transcript_18011/m.49985 type:complete len:140 (-) Transcript_18011:316-735(-)